MFVGTPKANLSLPLAVTLTTKMSSVAGGVCAVETSGGAMNSRSAARTKCFRITFMERCG
jgi:hypothetical protein